MHRKDMVQSRPLCIVKLQNTGEDVIISPDERPVLKDKQKFVLFCFVLGTEIEIPNRGIGMSKGTGVRKYMICSGTRIHLEHSKELYGDGEENVESRGLVHCTGDVRTCLLTPNEYFL